MDYVGLNAQLRPQKLAVKDLCHNRQWRYKEFHRFVGCCATLLLAYGAGYGARVACLSKNRAEIVALHLACARIGAIFVPLNWRLSVLEINTLIADCQPHVIFGDSIAADKGIECIDIDRVCSSCDQMEPQHPAAPAGDLPSLILYTSGTTGKAKGVVLTENNIMETAINFSVLGEVDSNSAFLCESPMFHVIGMITSVRPAFFCGGHLLISDGFIPERTLNHLADPELGISHYFCVPPMAAALRSCDSFTPAKFSGLKALFTGGAPLQLEAIKEWLGDGIAIVNGYGSTEAGTVFGMPLDREIIAQKGASAGIPTPRTRARIVNPAGQALPPGEPGELQLMADSLTGGYWQRHEDFNRTRTEDGWFRTGDIATVDEDGFFTIVDRKSDMYISGGENVYPAEIEGLLVEYPGIDEFAVVGVRDAKWGEVGCLFYVAEAEISVEQLAGYLKDKLARYKLPQRTLKVSVLPRNAAGKLVKQALREIFSESLE